MKTKSIRILFGICAISLICMIVALLATGKPLQEPFVPPEFDPSAVAGTPSVLEALDWRELDAHAFVVGICGQAVLNENSVDVWLTNPEDNMVWLKVRIQDGSGNVLGESGLICPGEYVQTVILQSVPSVGTQITLKVMAYEPKTYYSAGTVSLSTEIIAGT